MKMGSERSPLEKFIQNSVVDDSGEVILNQNSLDSALKFILQSDNTSQIEFPDVFLKTILWPSFGPDRTDSHALVIAAAVFALGKKGSGFHWIDAETLHLFFIRLVQLYHREDTKLPAKLLIIKAFNVLFLNLHVPAIRKESAPFFSLLSWRVLSGADVLIKKKGLEKQYSKQLSNFENATKKERAETSLLNNWISKLIDDVIHCNVSYKSTSANFSISALTLFRDLLAQLPSLRIVRTLLIYKNLFTLIEGKDNQSKEYNQLLNSLKLFLKFPVNEFTGELLTPANVESVYSANLTRLQVAAHTKLREGLSPLAFSTHDGLKKPGFLEESLSHLSDTELETLGKELEFQLPGKSGTDSKSLYVKSLIFQLDPYHNIEGFIRENDVFPDYETFETPFTSIPNYLPKLQGQFISISDYILRNILLTRHEAFTDLSEHALKTIERFQYKKNKGKLALTGNSKYAFKIASIEKNSKKLFKVSCSLNNISNGVLNEWSSLEKDDYILLIELGEKSTKSSGLQKWGVSNIQSATVRSHSRSKQSFVINVKPTNADEENVDGEDEFNLMVRFPKVLSRYHIGILEMIKRINSSEALLPEWLYEKILGVANFNQSILSIPGKGRISSSGIGLSTIEQAFPEFSVRFEGVEAKKRKAENTNSSLTSPFKFEIHSNEIILSKLENENTDSSTLSSSQVRALVSCLSEGLTVFSGVTGTGKKTIISTALNQFIETSQAEKFLIVSKNADTLEELFNILKKLGVSSKTIFNLSDSAEKKTKIKESEKTLQLLLKSVGDLASSIGLERVYGESISAALQFFEHEIKPLFSGFLMRVKQDNGLPIDSSSYPFANHAGPNFGEELPRTKAIKLCLDHYLSISSMFSDISNSSFLALKCSEETKFEHLLGTQGRVIGITSEEYLASLEILSNSGMCFQNIFFIEASQLTQTETILPLISNPQRLKRVVLVGDGAPLSHSVAGQSLIERLKSLGQTNTSFTEVYNKRAEIIELLKTKVNGLTCAFDGAEVGTVNPGMLNTTQLIALDNSNTTSGTPQVVIQAEYAIRLYQYLRLLAYPSNRITILCPAANHAALLKEISLHRLTEEDADDSPTHFRFGIPNISTATGFRGRDSDIVIYPLMNSSEFEGSVLPAAMAANLGLYLIGSKEEAGFESSKEDPILRKLIGQNDSHELQIVVGEMYSNVKRKNTENIESYKIVNLEHLSQLVEQMTEKRTSQKP